MRLTCTLTAIALAGCATAGGPGGRTPLHLDRVVLYQNGIGHFERSGHLDGDRLRLRLRPGEVDDVIKTLTVVDSSGEPQQVAAVLPTPSQSEGDEVEVEVVLSRPGRDIQVSYAVPTPAWKTTYRLAVPEHGGDHAVLLQSWAMIDNVSDESWQRVALTLATGAPLSYVTDLRTVHFVPRPDASGTLIAPTVDRAIVGESTRASDGDGDGIADTVDGCVTLAEDADGFQDEDGCPELDADGDGIMDEDDKCPIEAEVFNGSSDEDGCPDDGRTLSLVDGSAMVITDMLFFARDQATWRSRSQPVLNAVVSILKVHSQLRIRIEGHAAAGDRDPQRVATERAQAVRRAMIAGGIAADRLEAKGYGVDRPLVPGDSADARDQNRRVEFVLVHPLGAGDDGPPRPDATARAPTPPRPPRPLTPPAGPRLDAATLARSASTRTRSIEVSGSTRHVLGDRVTVPAGASSLVSVINRPVPGEEILLFRPEPGADASARHPFRAVRFELPAELGLEPGPVAVFADGSFAGEGLLARSYGGEVSYVPFALDGGTTVDVTTHGDEAPQRLVTVARGVATVENAVILRTTYTIAAGAAAHGRIFLRHPVRPGYQLGPVPDGTEHGDGTLLVPVSLGGRRTVELVIEERQPVERQIQLLDDGGANLTAYVEGANLPAPVRAQAQAVIAARAAYADLEQEWAALAARRDESRERAEELQDSLYETSDLRGAGADALRKRLISSLTAATAETDRLRLALSELSAKLATARADLQTSIAELGLEMSLSTVAARD